MWLHKRSSSCAAAYVRRARVGAVIPRRPLPVLFSPVIRTDPNFGLAQAVAETGGAEETATDAPEEGELSSSLGTGAGAGAGAGSVKELAKTFIKEDREKTKVACQASPQVPE